MDIMVTNSEQCQSVILLILCAPYAGYMYYDIFAKAPQIGYLDEWDDSNFEDFKIKLEGNHHEIAAVVLEPILQGAGGMRMYHPMFLTKARKLCDSYGILLIIDEIATGFGRTFAYQHANVVPDILLTGKAITGGYMSLAAVVCQRFVADTVCSDPETGGLLMHGPTYMANPLACSVATKSLEIIGRGDWEDQVDGINKQLQSLRKVASLQVVKEVRVLGAIGVVQLNITKLICLSFKSVSLIEVSGSGLLVHWLTLRRHIYLPEKMYRS